MTLIRFRADQGPEVDLSKTYDAVVVGSGAAGGMAAHAVSYTHLTLPTIYSV